MRNLMNLAKMLGAALLVPSLGLAHHVSDGAVPKNFTEGLLSGLAHPVIGPDHLAFIIALGLVAAMIKKPLWLPLLFVGGTLAGCIVHLYSVDLPMVEPMIASSVILFGAVLALKLTNESNGGVWLAAGLLAGVFHGYAYGESIIGSVDSALFAYLLGFAAIQFLVAHSVARIADSVPVIREHAGKIGLALSAIGGYFLVGAL